MERELIDLLMSSSDIAVAVSDADGRIIVFSPGFKTILGEVHPHTVAELTESVEAFDEMTERRLAPDERPLTRALRGEVVRDLLQGGDLPPLLGEPISPHAPQPDR